MADGGRKPIEKLKPGDRVLSADQHTGERSYGKVVRTFKRTSGTLLVIRTTDGSRIEATPEHPFWVEGKGFVAAKRLARSDLLADHEGRTYAVASVTERKGRFTVYNLEVEGTHTYYAGEAGWWVHNTCVPGDDYGKLVHYSSADNLDNLGISRPPGVDYVHLTDNHPHYNPDWAEDVKSSGARAYDHAYEVDVNGLNLEEIGTYNPGWGDWGYRGDIPSDRVTKLF